MMAMQIIYNSK